MLRTVLTAAAAATVVFTSAAQAETIFAVLNNDPSVGQRLVTIDSTSRAVTSSVVLGGGPLNPMASIDFRPATNTLYGVGSLNNQLYSINISNGTLTPVGAPLPVAGEIDFNPTVDALRLISGTSNYRINPNTGAVIAQDTSLAYQAGDVNAAATPAVRGAGYTNSVAGAITTTLYDVDVNTDALVTQNPANSGTLQTVGPLGVNLNTGLFGTFTGFDISPASGTAFLTDGGFGGATTLYTVSLTTGAATTLGTISGLGDRTVAAISVPEPASLGLAAVAGLGLLARRRQR